MDEMTPREIVKELDRFIIGQRDAKKAVAIAIRNRYRRKNMNSDLQEEVLPKNILMIGPTGVGKTEIARRLARLVRAPFLKVEVSKFTEVGYMGRDVDSIVRDLMETAVRMVKGEWLDDVMDKAKDMVEDRLLDHLLPQRRKTANPLSMIFGGGSQNAEEETTEVEDRMAERRERLRERLRDGTLENHYIDIEVESSVSPMTEMFAGSGVEEMGINLQDMFGGMFPKKKKKRRVPIAQAREIIKQQEAQKLIDMDEAEEEARKRVEESGLVFLDEIDKIAGQEGGQGPDVSREGVQRDILPIVEGSTVITKYGPIKTDHILFIAAGAFHVSRPADLIPELQGRFPIRVELESLSEDNFKEILTEPQNALTKQYRALLAVDGLTIEFADSGIGEIARIARMANEQMENIGARRLHTVLEKLLEEISFKGPEMEGEHVIIDDAFVKRELHGVIEDKDLSRYIL